MSTLRYHHTTGFGMAMNLPIAEAIARIRESARELSASAEKISYAQDFGSQIVEAVKRKTTSRRAATADDDEGDDNDSFANLLIKAVQRKKARYTQPR
jgi:hypothetical protein